MIHRAVTADKNVAGPDSPEAVQVDQFDLINLASKQREPENFNPLVAHFWADLILHHLRTSAAAGEINFHYPVDVLDLVPGFGQSNWLMVQALLRRSVEVENLRIRYIPVAPQRAWFTSIRHYPEFSSLFKSEVVVPMLWDYQKNDPCLLLPSGRKAWQTPNPCVVLAHDSWSSLPQRLFAVHYGKLLEANLTLLKNTVEPEKRSQQWKNVDSTCLDISFGALIEHYLTQFNSSPIPYPDSALALIDRLVSKLPQQYLLLSAAKGIASEHSLRLWSFSQLIDSYEKEGRFSVNFHFLSHYLRQIGSETIEIEMQKGLVLQIAMHGHAEGKKRINGMASKVDAGMFHHSCALSEAVTTLGLSAALDSRLALLKLSQYDPAIFIASHAALIKSFTKSPNFDHKSWRDALERVWGNYLPTTNSSKLHSCMAPVAMHCGHWKLARSVILRGMQTFGRASNDLANLAWCETRTGNIKKARALITEALSTEPGNSLVEQVRERIDARLAGWDRRWRVDLHHEALPIVLEPLDLSHAEAFYYQYRDPQIAVMTGLPALTTLDEVKNWITEQEIDQNRVNYSIMHADYGFVGYINLAVSEHAAYFCFWTGVDFQGHGVATAAGRLACQHACKLGVNVMLTSAYSDNARSIRALKRIGFVELKIRALPPDQDRIFYSMIANEDTYIDSAAELVNYYIREKLPLLFSKMNEIENVKMEV